MGCNASNLVFETISEKRNFILRKREHVLAKKRIAIWLWSETIHLGHSLRSKIKSSAIMVFSEKQRQSVRHQIQKMGIIAV